MHDSPIAPGLRARRVTCGLRRPRRLAAARQSRTREICNCHGISLSVFPFRFPFRLLAMLLEKPGELVTREELQARLWPQTIVDFDHGLNKAISLAAANAVIALAPE